jgi:hypothetical protein
LHIQNFQHNNIFPYKVHTSISLSAATKHTVTYLIVLLGMESILVVWQMNF